MNLSWDTKETTMIEMECSGVTMVNKIIKQNCLVEYGQMNHMNTRDRAVRHRAGTCNYTNKISQAGGKSCYLIPVALSRWAKSQNCKNTKCGFSFQIVLSIGRHLSSRVFCQVPMRYAEIVNIQSVAYYLDILSNVFLPEVFPYNYFTFSSNLSSKIVFCLFLFT